MKKNVFFMLLISYAFSFGQKSEKRTCIGTTISYKVNPPSMSCNLSSNTTVDVTWAINCPKDKELANGVSIIVQFLNKFGTWGNVKTKTIPSNVGKISINYSGLRFNTNQKIRFYTFLPGYKCDVNDVTKENKWEEYAFDIGSCDKIKKIK